MSNVIQLTNIDVSEELFEAGLQKIDDALQLFMSMEWMCQNSSLMASKLHEILVLGEDIQNGHTPGYRA